MTNAPPPPPRRYDVSPFARAIRLSELADTEAEFGVRPGRASEDYLQPNDEVKP